MARPDDTCLHGVPIDEDCPMCAGEEGEEEVEGLDEDEDEWENEGDEWDEDDEDSGIEIKEPEKDW